jgi:hypothetical protein
MSPSHTNKAGVRYRYYVSQALLQSKVRGSGSIGRVPADEIEALVLAALRHHLQASGVEPQPTADSDRDLVERHIERITLTAKHITLQMRPSSDAADAVTVLEEAGPELLVICTWRPSPSLGPAPWRRRSRASSTSRLTARR